MEDDNQNTRRGFLNLAGISLAAGSVFALASSNQAQASSLSSTWYNIREYDTGAGDQSSIQNAIDAAARDGGGVVYIPSGIYTVESLRIKKNVTLMGEGMGTLLLQQEGANRPVIATGGASAYPVGVCSLRIKGSASGGSSSYGVFLGSKSTGNGFTKPDGQHIISQVFIENMKGDGIYIRKEKTAEVHSLNLAGLKHAEMGITLGGVTR